MRQKIVFFTQKLSYYSAILAALALPFPLKIMNLFFVIWMVCWCIELIFRGKYHFEKPSGKNLSIYFLFILYLWMLTSVLWSHNYVESKTLLVRRIAYLIIPIFYLFGVNKYYRINKIVFAFFAGSLLSGLTFLAIGLYKYEIHQLQVTSIEQLSEALVSYKHRTYFCICFSFAIIYFYYLKSSLIKRMPKYLYYAAFELIYVLFLGITYLCQGRMALIIYLITTIALIAAALWKKGFKIMVIVSSVVLLAAAFFIIKNQPRMKNLQLNKEKLEAFDPRYDLWRNSIQCIKANNKIIGTGIGDRQDVFAENHKKPEFKIFFFPTTNSHNNFMDTQLELGLVGVLILMVILFSGYRKMMEFKNVIFLITTTIIWLLFMQIETVGITSTTVYMFTFSIFTQALAKKEPDRLEKEFKNKLKEPDLLKSLL